MMNLLRCAIWLLPNCGLKHRLLKMVGYSIHPTATVRPNLVWKVDRIEVGAGSRMDKFNVIKSIRSLSLGAQASLGRMNLISAHPVFRRLYPQGSQVIIADNATISSRHTIDCSAALEVREFGGIFGHGTTVLTHSIDLAIDAQQAKPVVIGARCFVGTNCLLLGGAELPERSVLAGGSVLVRSKNDARSGIWAGAPAKWIGEADGAWFDRTETHTRRVWVPDTQELIQNAF